MTKTTAFNTKEELEDYLRKQKYIVNTGGKYSEMTLRDWYAGQALMGLIIQRDQCISSKILAEESYKVADAMIKAREA